jgi:hypothetical protein
MDYSGPKATPQMSPLISRLPACLRYGVDMARGGCDLQKPFERNRLRLGESKAGVAQRLLLERREARPDRREP